MADDLNAAVESLGRTAMRIADERNALLKAAKYAYTELDNFYDVDQPAGEAAKEYPFPGAGEVMRKLRAAIALAEHS